MVEQIRVGPAFLPVHTWAQVRLKIVLFLIKFHGSSESGTNTFTRSNTHTDARTNSHRHALACSYDDLPTRAFVIILKLKASITKRTRTRNSSFDESKIDISTTHRRERNPSVVCVEYFYLFGPDDYTREKIAVRKIPLESGIISLE